jgi:hypothetical protein
MRVRGSCYEPRNWYWVGAGRWRGPGLFRETPWSFPDAGISDFQRIGGLGPVPPGALSGGLVLVGLERAHVGALLGEDEHLH